MRIHLGSDHAGFELRTFLVQHLTDAGHEVIDHGADTYDAQDDYPAFCLAAATAVVADPGSLGIVIGGSGNGEQIAANKVLGVRAALGWNVETAALSREHNDANVLGLGARMHDQETATLIAETFVGTPFSQDPRHIRRIEQVAAYERSR
jgi:ribose 5-phosphate isomerase B